LPTSVETLAPGKGKRIARERHDHVFGRHPRRMLLFVEPATLDFDAEVNPIRLPTEAEYKEPKLDPAVTRLLRAWAKADLTIRQYRVLLALLHEGGMKPIPAPLPAVPVATGL